MTTLFRVIAGLVLGILVGIVLGIICYKIAAINMLISPIISIIKATPVASFIVLLWIKLSGSTLAILISFMMVLPIVWHSTVEALKNIPHQLLEVSYVFDFPVVKKIKLVYLPTMAKYLFPAFISSVGFAWKSEIATEIIAYTSNSIGQQINDGKFYFNTPAVYAWTLIVIILSLLLEKGTAVLLERIKVNA